MSFSHAHPQGIRWAEPCDQPSFIPARSAPRGTKGQGLAYERAFAEALTRSAGSDTADYRRVYAGQWFKYQDMSGIGYCQPDVIWARTSAVVVFECKLSDTRMARAQLEDLYKPVLQGAFPNSRILPITVVKSVHREPDIWRIRQSLSKALASAAAGGIPTLHWLGGPLLLDTPGARASALAEARVCIEGIS